MHSPLAMPGKRGSTGTGIDIEPCHAVSSLAPGFAIWRGDASLWQDAARLKRERASVRLHCPHGTALMLVWLGWLVCGALVAQSQGLNLTMRQYAEAEGLSQSVVNCMVQDHQGFLWAGTQDGLNRFDGREFRVYRSRVDDARSLADSFIRCLFVDCQGVLWVGTASGLNRYDRDQDSFDRLLHDEDDPRSLSGNAIRSLCQDRHGRLWVGTFSAGLNRMEADGGFTRFLHHTEDPHSLSDNHVEAIFEDDRGRIWMGTGRGVCEYMDEGRFQRYRKPQETPGSGRDAVRCINQLPDGRLVMGTFSGMLDIFDPETGEFESMMLADDADIETVTGILVTREQGVWVSTLGAGLFFFSPRMQLKQAFRAQPLMSRRLKTNSLRAILQDQGGLIWLGTYEAGLQVFDLRHSAFRTYSVNPSRSDGLPSNRVRAFAEDDEGHLWIGMDGGGLSHLNFETGQYTHHRHDEKDPGSMAHDSVMEILIPEEGDYWIGLYGGGVDRFDPQTGVFSHYPAGGPQGLSSDKAIALHLAFDRLWIGTYGGGLNVLNPATDELKVYRFDPRDLHSLGQDRIWDIESDAQDVLWIGTYGGGLSLLDVRTGSFHNFSRRLDDARGLLHDTVFNVELGPGGEFWLATGYGIARVLRPGRLDLQFQTFTREDGLPGDKVYGMELDSDGNFWLSTNSGLCQFNPDTGSCRNFNASHGLQSDEFKEGAYLRMRSGAMVFGGPNGFNLFYPSEIELNTHVPPVVMTGFSVFNQPRMVGGDLADLSELTLTHKDSVISFRFAALDFAAPERNQYRYKLTGFHDEWIPLGPQAEVSFTNLDGGTYELHVQASNNDGLWNEDGLGLKIKVLPPPWKTWWAYLLYLAALLTVLRTWYSLKTKAHRIELARQMDLVESLQKMDKLKEAHARDLEEKVQERTMGLRERNDELRRLHAIVSSINQMQAFSDVIETLLVQGRAMFSPADLALFLHLNGGGAHYRVWCCQRESPEQAPAMDVDCIRSWVMNEDPSAQPDGVFVKRGLAGEHAAPWCSIQSALVMTLTKGADISAMLIMVSTQDEEAFGESHVDKGRRFREHAMSAFLKAVMFSQLKESHENLREAQSRLVESAHLAGMAENASEVLHSAGNALNSVVIAAQQLHVGLSKNISLGLLKRVVGLIRENEEDLVEFFRSDSRAHRLPQALNQIASELQYYQDEMCREALSLHEKIENVRSLVEAQGRLTQVRSRVDSDVDIMGLLQHLLDAMRDTLNQHQIQVRQSGPPLPLMPANAFKLRRVLEILLINAIEAVEACPEDQPRLITWETRVDEAANRIILSVEDNGLGIPSEVMSRIFEPSFSTKPGRLGGQLHYAANQIAALRGAIRAESDGENGGAKFTMEFRAAGSRNITR